jgi:hypothetical protein
MAWPFTGVTAPNFDSGFVTLPNSFTAVPNSPGGTSWLIGAHLSNQTNATVTVSLKDGSGAVIFTTDLLAGEVKPIEWPFMPASGTYQWMADTASAVVAKLWGYA